MKMFEVGKRYKMLCGDVVQIDTIDSAGIYCIIGRVVENLSGNGYADFSEWTNKGSYWEENHVNYKEDHPKNLIPVPLEDMVGVEDCTLDNSNDELLLKPNVKVSPIDVRPVDFVTDSLRVIINAGESLHDRERRAVIAFLMNLWEIEND